MTVDWVVVEWSPTDGPFETTQTWVALDHVTSITIRRRLNEAGQLTLDVENGHGGETPQFDPDTLYRWRQIRVRFDDGGSNAGPLFHGWIQEVHHLVASDPMPSATTITATDRLGALTRTSTLTFEANPGQPGYVTDAATWAQAVDNYSGLNAFAQEIDWETFSTCPVFFETQERTSLDGALPINVLEGKALELIMRALEVEGGSTAGGADGAFVVNGRFTTLKALDAAAAFVVSDTPGAGEFTAQWPSIDVAEPGTDYYNAVEATGYRTYPVTVTTAGPTDFVDTLSRSGLATDRRAWVEADAHMWSDLYSQANTWPRSLTLHLAPRGAGAGLAKEVSDATNYLGRSWIQVELTPGGLTQKTWKAVVTGVEHVINADRWTARLEMSSGDRWAVFPTWAEIGKVGTSLVGASVKVGP